MKISTFIISIFLLCAILFIASCNREDYGFENPVNNADMLGKISPDELYFQENVAIFDVRRRDIDGKHFVQELYIMDFGESPNGKPQ
ncbi:MAG: hypothetical protein ACXITV_02010 [Luteibaculaceae bacterium]